MFINSITIRKASRSPKEWKYLHGNHIPGGENPWWCPSGRWGITVGLVITFKFVLVVITVNQTLEVSQWEMGRHSGIGNHICIGRHHSD